jgi:hypothetical protein
MLTYIFFQTFQTLYASSYNTSKYTSACASSTWYWYQVPGSGLVVSYRAGIRVDSHEPPPCLEICTTFCKYHECNDALHYAIICKCHRWQEDAYNHKEWIFDHRGACPRSTSINLNALHCCAYHLDFSSMNTS